MTPTRKSKDSKKIIQLLFQNRLYKRFNRGEENIQVGILVKLFDKLC